MILNFASQLLLWWCYLIICSDRSNKTVAWRSAGFCLPFPTPLLPSQYIKQTYESHERVVRLCSDWLTFIMLLEQMRGFLFSLFFSPINSFIQLFTFRFLSPATTNFWSIVRCSLPKFGEASISLWRPRNASFYLLFSSWMVNDQSLFFFFRREVKVLGCSSKLLYFNFSSCEIIVW